MTLFGKYRGKVENNLDPYQQGRIQVSVPGVLPGTTNWAMPCVPFAGSSVGFFAIPPQGANVWVEFEAGDPNRPIWSGCFWGLGECPASPAVAEVKVFKTSTCTVTLSDLPGAGGITLETTSGFSVKLSATGITLSTGAGTIEISGSRVAINNGALEVM
jgi:uncharacterized protein involved in type VI secretion and phage assembly